MGETRDRAMSVIERFSAHLASLVSKYRAEIMGLSIIWIMLFHSGIPVPDHIILKSLWYVFVSFGGGFGVNIFLILSGFGLMYSALKRDDRNQEESILSFYKRRVIRILPAYLLVATVYYLIESHGIGAFFYNLFFLNFIIDGKRDFWYILAILICYLIFPLYKKWIHKLNFRVIFLLSCLMIVLVNLLLYFTVRDLYLKWEIFLWRLPCFLIGCHLGIIVYKKQIKDYLLLLTLSSLLGIILLAVFGYFHAPAMVERIELVLLSLFLINIFCLIFDLTNRFATVINKIFAFLGKRSLEIYLIHISVGVLLVSWIAQVIGTGFWIRLILYFGCSIVLAILLKALTDLAFQKIAMRKNKVQSAE